MCRLLRMSLLCLLLLFMFCTSVSFASINYNGFTEFDYNGNRYDFLNYIFETVFNEDFDEFGVHCQINGVSHNSSGTDTSYTRYTNFCNIAFDNSYTSMYVLITRSTNYKFINSDYNVIEFKFSKSGFNSDYYGTFSFRINTNGTYGMVNGSNNNSGTSIYAPTLNNTNKGAFLYSANKWYYRTGQSIAFPTNNLKYSSYKNSTFNVNINGETTHNFVKADYNITDSINIGYLTNYQYFDEVQGHLAVYSGTSNIDNANYWDQIASFQYIKDVGFYNNKLGFNKNTGVITIPPNVLQYDHGYSIWFDGSNNNGTEDYNSTPEVFYFVVPLGSSATSGDINSDNPTGVDFDFINSVEYLTQFSSGNTKFIANNLLPPGDGSGDIFGFTYIDHDQWGFGDFIRVTFNNFINVLYDYTDVSYNMGWLGVHNSSEFITPSDNALITIVSLFCNCFLLMSSISWFFFTICSIGVLDVDKIIKDKADLGLF